MGPAGGDLLPIDPRLWHDIVAKLALTMIAFLLGGELSRTNLAAHGRAILAVSLAVTAVTVVTIGGALLLGLLIGLPAAVLTGRIAPGEPTLVEALGVVLLCAGLSIYFEVSFLLTGMTAGMVVVNMARHHDYAFHEIEHISWPFLVLFFVLAGAAVNLEAIAEAGLLAAGFIALRLAGRVVGGWIGGRFGGLGSRESWLIGLALTPQAGVALGMALVASEAAPAIGGTILAATVATTVFSELTGPVLTRFVVARVNGKIPGKSPE